MTEKQKPQTNEERGTPRKPDGILTKKMNGKTFVTEIYFDKKSKDTFQDKLLKAVQVDEKFESKKEISSGKNGSKMVEYHSR